MCLLFVVSIIQGSTVYELSETQGEQKLKGKVEQDVVDELEVVGSVRE